MILVQEDSQNGKKASLLCCSAENGAQDFGCSRLSPNYPTPSYPTLRYPTPSYPTPELPAISTLQPTWLTPPRFLWPPTLLGKTRNLSMALALSQWILSLLSSASHTSSGHDPFVHSRVPAELSLPTHSFHNGAPVILLWCPCLRLRGKPV